MRYHKNSFIFVISMVDSVGFDVYDLEHYLGAFLLKATVPINTFFIFAILLSDICYRMSYLLLWR